MQYFDEQVVSYHWVDGVLEPWPEDHILPQCLWDKVLSRRGRRVRGMSDQRALARARNLYKLFCQGVSREGGKACLVLDFYHARCYVSLSDSPAYPQVILEAAVFPEASEDRNAQPP